jgi:hypothetical protein
MPPAPRDLTGFVFGRLTVIARNGHLPRGTKRTMLPAWLVRCECGVEKTVIGSAMTTNGLHSCGTCRPTNWKHGHSGGKARRDPTYVTWQSMKSRCTNPADPGWAYYGGRGITVCARWLDSFEDFLADVGERPPRMTLDRKDVNGNYEPDNVRWATSKEQNNNRRPSRCRHCGNTRSREPSSRSSPEEVH